MSEEKKPFLIWMGAATDPSGYGEATRNYVLGLDDLNEFNIKLMNKSFWHGEKLDLRRVISRLEGMAHNPIPIDQKDITVAYNLTPENYMIQRNVDNFIGVTTFETDRLPILWVLPMRAMNAVVTYSQFNKRTFQESGIDRPIYVVPHGVDVDRYNPDVLPLEEAVEAIAGRYAFGSNFEWTERKNPRALIKAYYSAFQGKKDVVLVLKVYYQHPINESVSKVKNEIAEIKASFGQGADLPPIILFTDMLKEEDMSSFYTALDAYVLPSRGEGWSLTHSEAMSSGLPTIGVNWSGNTEYMTDENSLLIDYELKGINHEDMPHNKAYVGHKWAEVDEDHLVATMRGLYSDPQNGCRIGRNARQDMCNKWTWTHACRKMADVIKEVRGV